MTTTLTDPPAPAPAPPQLSPGGRTAVRAMLVITGVTILAGTLALLATGAAGLSAFRLVTDHRSLPAAMRVLTVDTADSPVAVRIIADSNATEPRADVRMLTTDRADRQELTVTDEPGGTVLRVEGQTSFLAWGDPGEVTVTLPPELGRRLAVTVRQETGMLMVDADLDELTATATDASVLLRGTLRRSEIRTQNGDVLARQPISVSESFDASTVDGSVEVRFADAPPRIGATTRNGEVSVALPAPGPYLVHAQSANGPSRVRVPETTDAAAAVAEVNAGTENGAVTIETTSALPSVDDQPWPRWASWLR
ncbi:MULTISPECIES: DUF4097 family beta strand repeat-containing protein [Mycobacteriaceae]|uniref:Adhesin domain-containing protein n=1 Tax=Mycolicibacterium neoaurum VKM Ac-1815D TaxID=700508 RepID=V5XGD5_MYCNE|nr:MULTISPECIES: hypothetical protein [Mycobacteriaceae]AMO07062.1 hypothetical protein MyAD_19950 [Mycolicibacterium neoaurum]AXK74565.1 hypothetical protein DXK33_04985 [Mycolicibacterium neoaurum]KUM06826.1 hypothetical protein AVZ31_19645 [Mycolicibacterium neoaurum]